MRRFVEWIVGILCVLVIAAILFPLTATSGRDRRRTACLTHLKQSSVSMLIYLGDHNDRFPERDEWTDVLYPYAKTWTIFHCPQATNTAWGYAFNGALSRAKQTKLQDPVSVFMVYDSVNPMKNASDLVTSLPAVPRHNRNFVGYADGHVKPLVPR